MRKNLNNLFLFALSRRSFPRVAFYAGSMLALVALFSRSYAAQTFDHDGVPLGSERAGVLPQASSRRRRPADAAASYSRFSSALQDEASIEMQREKCREGAAREGKTIADELEFSDRAISGTKRDREGLNSLLAAAEAGRFSTLFFYSLSRLARESVITMPILKRLVYVNHVRVVTITEGLDSARDGWEMVAQILAMQHERYIKDLSANVFGGQENNIRNGFSVGDYCFGFTSLPVPGSENTRRGRHARPRMVYVIDPPTAKWVLQIFHWFVVDRRKLRWIARELNRLGAPKDHRARTKEWRHQYLLKLLSNRKYVGIWPWGELQNVRDPATGDVTQERRPAEESEKWPRDFPHLRLIDDETFAKARNLLQENKEHYAHCHDDDGHFSHDQNGAAAGNPRHLLSGLVVCGHCGRTFNVGGANSKYMFCPGYHQGVCPCQTTLRRDRAETMILNAISQRILESPEWLKVVLDCTQAAWCQSQKTLPNELRDTESAVVVIDRKIANLIDALENQAARDPDVQQRLGERREERRRLEDQLASLRRKTEAVPQKPTEAWIVEQLHNLRQILSASAPAAAFALRDLVGGQITVEEVQRPGRKRHFLRGSFTIRIGTLVAAMGKDESLAAPSLGHPGETITLDFQAPNSKDALAERVKALWDQDLANKEIAIRMNLRRSQVTGLLKHWSLLHGEKLMDGLTRRGERARKNFGPPRARAIADKVMELAETGLLLEEIGRELGCGADTVTAAVRYWHVSRGLPVPDGRTRRKKLSHKVSRPRQSGTDCSDRSEDAA